MQINFVQIGFTVNDFNSAKIFTSNVTSRFEKLSAHAEQKLSHSTDLFFKRHLKAF